MLLAKKLVLSLVVISLPLLVVVSPVAHAACKNDFFGIPVWYKYLKTDSNCNIITEGVPNVPALVILGLIDIALFMAGFLAVIMIIWGGYKFILSDGSPDQIAGGRKTILNAVIGLIIAILAAQIVRFIANKLSGS